MSHIFYHRPCDYFFKGKKQKKFDILQYSHQKNMKKNDFEQPLSNNNLKKLKRQIEELEDIIVKKRELFKEEVLKVRKQNSQ